MTATASTEAAERPASAELLARLADTVQAAATRGSRELRVLVRPPELGHIDIRVVETSERLRVAIMASRHEVGELLQQQLPALRFALEARAPAEAGDGAVSTVRPAGGRIDVRV